MIKSHTELFKNVCIILQHWSNLLCGIWDKNLICLVLLNFHRNFLNLIIMIQRWFCLPSRISFMLLQDRCCATNIKFILKLDCVTLLQCFWQQMSSYPALKRHSRRTTDVVYVGWRRFAWTVASFLMPFISVPCGLRIPAVQLGFTLKPCILKTSYTAARPCGDCCVSFILLAVLMLVTLWEAPEEAAGHLNRRAEALRIHFPLWTYKEDGACVMCTWEISADGGGRKVVTAPSSPQTL